MQFGINCPPICLFLPDFFGSVAFDVFLCFFSDFFINLGDEFDRFLVRMRLDVMNPELMEKDLRKVVKILDHRVHDEIRVVQLLVLVGQSAKNGLVQMILAADCNFPFSSRFLRICCY